MPPAVSLTRRQNSNVNILAQDWSKHLLELEESSSSSSTTPSTALQTPARVIQAAARTLPLLQDATSVPFVCRYRTDIIHPLTTEQVHLLCDLTLKHRSLESLRKRLLAALPENAPADLLRRIQSSTSKHELEDLYAPYKPPSKGSIIERIQKEHPALVQAVDDLWTAASNGSVNVVPAKSLQPRDAVVHLLGTKIAADPRVVDLVLDNLSKYCRIGVKQGNKDTTTAGDNDKNKYQTYYDFSQHLASLRNYQVLAIRRGVDQKALKMSYDIDGDKMEGAIRWVVLNTVLPEAVAKTWRTDYGWRELASEAIHDAWSRLLRRRGTSRIWSEKCKTAEERAIQVFEQNLKSALLAPPLNDPSYLLAMDPGFQAGIKCAVLGPDGQVEGPLSTVQFLGGNKREKAVQQLAELLRRIAELSSNSTNSVKVALGNGHGTQESRSLIQDASASANVPIKIHLVNEAGASVWSVTSQAKNEFPLEPPAAIAAISIGRRLQNPLHELVKVPPRSLGLGMYQHDISEKELDQKLHMTSVDAVATVGVDANSCSLEILQKVPGLDKLASKILKARPICQRKDLLDVAGLGPKTFENCAAFVRVQKGPEELDATLVHPESYELARYLLKKFHWKLSEIPKALPPRDSWEREWESTLTKAAKKFNVSRERVLAVIENLVDSMTQKDPRLVEASKKPSAGSSDGCSLLSPEELEDLRKACPVRKVVGTIRSITDFGAFVDFGGHNDGLLHVSKMGPVRLDTLMIGQEVGIDILAVDDNHRVSLGLTGLGLEADQRVARVPVSRDTGRSTAKGSVARRNMSTAVKSRSMPNSKQSKTEKAKGSKRSSSGAAKTKKQTKRRKTSKT